MSKRDAQATGSAITYGRRYTLQSLMALAPEDDDDGANASEIDPQQRRDKDALRPPTDRQLAELNKLFERLGASPENIAATATKFSNGRTDKPDGLLKIEVQKLSAALEKKFQNENTIA